MSCVLENEKKTGDEGVSMQAVRWIQPCADVAENKDGFTLTLDLPGVGRDSLDVTLDDRTLTVTGARDGFSDGQTLYRESRAAGFRRAFTLGDSIDAGAITAAIKNGVAKIRLPKAVAAKPRTIKVTG